MGGKDDVVALFAEVVEAIGTPRFDDKIFRALNRLTMAEYMNIWAYSPNDGMCQVGVASLTDVAAARSLTRAYVGGYYKLDPNFSDMEKPKSRKRIIVRKMDINSYKSEEYRRRLINSGEIADKIAIIWHTDKVAYNLNIYRLRNSARYTESDISIVRTYSPLIASVVYRHWRYFNVRRDMRSGRMLSFVQRVANVAEPPLTQRELDVIGRIALGASAEAIALELGIGFESVVTHRKHAYAKLGISSQGELFGLCINNVYHLLESSKPSI